MNNFFRYTRLRIEKNEKQTKIKQCIDFGDNKNSVLCNTTQIIYNHIKITIRKQNLQRFL